MNVGARVALTAALTLATTPHAVAQAPDTSLTESYEPTAKAVGTRQNRTNHGADVGQFNTNVQRLDVGPWGSTALSFGVQKSNGEDPIKGGSTGATQFYGSANAALTLYRPETWIRALRWDIGFDFNEKNSALQNRRKAISTGPSITLDTAGVTVIAAHVVQEWNHNGPRQRDFAYQPALQLVVFSERPTPLAGLPLRVQSTVIVETPKGRDGFGVKTAASLLTISELILDVGALAWHQPRRLDAFAGVEYWLNKTGSDHAVKSGAVEETALFGLTAHF